MNINLLGLIMLSASLFGEPRTFIAGIARYFDAVILPLMILFMLASALLIVFLLKLLEEFLNSRKK